MTLAEQHGLKVAGPIMKLIMKLRGVKGIAYTPKLIFIHPDRANDWGLIQHELVHKAQMKREGTMKFLVKYLYYHFRHGYDKNPYEVEAREAENGYS